MVKISCEVCKLEGTLQKVGNNYYRIRYYDGVGSNSKPRFHYHQNSKAYALEELGKLRGTGVLKNTVFDHDQNSYDQDGNYNRKVKESSHICKKASGRSLVWFRTSACHVDDPGSNPGDRTKNPQAPAGTTYL